MALPPTGLTTLLYDASTPEAMYDVLAANDCLSTFGQRGRAQVVAMMSDAVAEYEARARGGVGYTGPTEVDRIAAALVRSPYLSKHGQQLSRSDERDARPPKRAWWQFWK